MSRVWVLPGYIVGALVSCSLPWPQYIALFFCLLWVEVASRKAIR